MLIVAKTLLSWIVGGAGLQQVYQIRHATKRNPEEEHLTCGSSHVCVSGILKFLTNYSVV